MIRFNINGEYIDIPADFSLQLQRKNILFAFDDAECDRSTSFSIPATPTNNRIFKLAKCEAIYGDGMRRRYKAQMQAGVVSKDGYLYIDSYEPDNGGGKYKAIFLTGELIGLKALRDLGSIKDIAALQGLKYAVEVGGSIGENVIWAHIPYYQDDGLHPSIGITQILNILGYDDYYHLTTRLNLRLIPEKLNKVQSDFLDYNIRVNNTSQGGYAPMAQTAVNVSEIYIEGVNSAEGFYMDAVLNSDRVLVKYTSGGVSLHAYITQARTRYHTILTFGGEVGADYFIGYFNLQTGSGQDYENLSDFHFLGGYSFDVNGQTTGTPLASRDIDLQPDTSFCIIKKEWYIDGVGWKIDTPLFVLTNCNILFDDYGNNPPDIYRLVDNLPDFTLIDVFKMAANLTGRVLNYTDENGVIFENDIFFDGERVDINGKVIKVSNLTRSFADYAQNNRVKFAEDESQYDYERDESNYTIDNVNLPEENDLYEMPAGNGGIDEDNGSYATLAIRGEQSVDVIGMYDTSVSNRICRVKLRKNSRVQVLCNDSTSQSLKVRMSLLEYEQIRPKTQLYYNGIVYMWVESQWSKDVATFKVAKFTPPLHR